MHDERFKQAMLHKSSTYSVMNSVMTAESGLEEVVINDFKTKSPMKEPATQRDSEERKKQHDIRTPELSSKNASLVAKEKITLSSFKILKEIGSGSFGKVYKVCLFDNNILIKHLVIRLKRRIPARSMH